MPTYDYRCPEGHEFERFQRMSDEPRAECPECGKEAVRLLSGGAGFLFKGEGFYITDYRSDDYRKAAKADERAASNGGTTSGKAAEGSSGEGSGKAAGEGSGGKAADKGADKGSGKGAKGSTGKTPSGGPGASGSSSSTSD